jgi:hypothetical protein
MFFASSYTDKESITKVATTNLEKGLLTLKEIETWTNENN